MTDYLIANARIVNEGQRREADVLIRKGRIEKIAPAIDAPSDVEVIDAEGRFLLPGMIDDQVHFREPGLTAKADLASESRAAVAGGITSFMDMPNVKPPTIDNDSMAAKHELARGRCAANFGFHFGATNDNIEDIKQLDTRLAAGVKIFMGASTGKMLVDDDTALEQIFEHSPLTVLTHCEDTPMIEANAARARDLYGDDVPMSEHPIIRSREACYASSSKAIDLARRHGTRLHILHITTADELELFERGAIGNKQITAEACIHHLFFEDTDYAARGTLIKCNPAIKTHADREALLKALAEDRIDVLATDHAPHLFEEKDNPYFDAPAGLPLVQHALVSLLDHVSAGHFSLEQLVTKAAHNPADLFGVAERGYIREGYWADLVLVDMDGQTVVDNEPVLAKCGWTPFAGHTFQSRIMSTFVSGQLAYHGGKLSQGCIGQALTYDRERGR
ncbi:dihydroorotase [Salinisphaera sp.]|uniref:dihydroorotase n=1 Tax=Salinisphaera sp. TaxID=1914330 RepID=UPI000C46B3C8|nr:dihydroorotase [Salinisphaera sp.]MAS10352.1 dihydroorotase [Salinisphaera sp.]|tara:strand:- start:150 stop:1496 length:1347 start_codon:yes stop_codon:yes gene_type:complete